MNANSVLKLLELRGGRSKAFNLKLLERAELLVKAGSQVEVIVWKVGELHQ